MFLVVNYCSDMFRSQLLAIFRELIIFSKFAASAVDAEAASVEKVSVY
jgi:hypothetical protein